MDELFQRCFMGRFICTQKLESGPYSIQNVCQLASNHYSAGQQAVFNQQHFDLAPVPKRG